MQHKKDYFHLDPDVKYLNCAYMSPLLRSVEEAGIQGIKRKRNPYHLKPEDFFTEVEELRFAFADMVQAKASQIALIPSASYGLSTAIQNVPFRSGQHALTIEQEFPSDIFPLKRWCSQHQAELRMIGPDTDASSMGENWNEKILNEINEDTAMLVLSSIHWMHGLKFSLEEIGARCKAVGAKLIVDGTQSVGALPIDVQTTYIDALVCASYKWMMGPYSLGLAYLGEAFEEGIPLEESWMNRSNAQDFQGLAAYDTSYKPGAGRYNVGETSNFILVPMLKEALRQLNEWDVQEIQQYCKELIAPLLAYCEEIGCHMEEERYRSSHLFGLNLPEGFSTPVFLQKLKEHQIIISLRGNSIRVSPNVYNTREDIETLIQTMEMCRK